METTEKVVEAYVRYVKGWFTLPNIKCDGQFEIDLLAVDISKSGVAGRYHIESGISISQAYSKLTNKPFSPEVLKQRTKTAQQRRTLGYFAVRKFADPCVVAKLSEFGFRGSNYKKIIVTWGWTDDVPQVARRANVELWDFRVILAEIADRAIGLRTYFTDDTMRTLQLMTKALQSRSRLRSKSGVLAGG